MNSKKTLNVLLRSDMRSFVARSFRELNPGTNYQHNWHIDAILYELQRIENGENKRLIITCPPRSLKSLIVSVAFPAWLLGHHPETRIIAASYGSDLSKKLSIDTRSVMESTWYAGAFPVTRMDPMKNTQDEIRTTKHGMRYASSVGGSLTGLGGNLIIIDDPHKPDEALSDVKRETVHNWFRNTLLSRLNDKKNDAIIIIQQRVHEDDLVGRLLEESDEWTHLNLPAMATRATTIRTGPDTTIHRKKWDLLHPERESKDVLRHLRLSMGSHVFNAQYLQQPIPTGGGIIKIKDFKRLKYRPNHNYNIKDSDIIVQSWDVATSVSEHADYSVGQTWLIREGKYYLLEMIRKRIESFYLRQLIEIQYHEWEANAVLIEIIGAGEAIANELHYTTQLNIVPIRPVGDKKTRMMAEVAAIESGKVYIPEEAPWLADLEYEVRKFPEAPHDDIVDAMSQFLFYARKISYKPKLESRATLIPNHAPSSLNLT